MLHIFGTILFLLLFEVEIHQSGSCIVQKCSKANQSKVKQLSFEIWGGVLGRCKWLKWINSHSEAAKFGTCGWQLLQIAHGTHISPLSLSSLFLSATMCTLLSYICTFLHLCHTSFIIFLQCYVLLVCLGLWQLQDIGWCPMGGIIQYYDNWPSLVQKLHKEATNMALPHGQAFRDRPELFSYGRCNTPLHHVIA